MEFKNLTFNNIDGEISKSNIYSSSKLNLLYQQKIIAENTALTANTDKSLGTVNSSTLCYTLAQNHQSTLQTVYAPCIYNQVIKDLCGYYNTTTGEFFPKKPGIYRVFASITSISGNKVQMQWKKNNDVILEFFNITTSWGIRCIPFDGVSDKLVIYGLAQVSTGHGYVPYRNYFEAYLLFAN